LLYKDTNVNSKISYTDIRVLSSTQLYSSLFSFQLNTVKENLFLQFAIQVYFMKMATPRYMAATASSAAKSRNKTPVEKPKIGHQKWNASPKIDNPDGPIKPLPPMNNYRRKMDAPRKKHIELLTKIKANKQEALVLPKSYLSRPFDEEQYESVKGLGWVCKDNNVYCSLPPMGNEEEYKSQYIENIIKYEKLGQGASGLVVQGWRRSDNKEVAIKKVKKSNVGCWGNVNGELYPIEYCHLRMVNGCSRIANLLDAFNVDEEFVLILETMEECCSISDFFSYLSMAPIPETQCKLIFRQLVESVEHCHTSGIFHRDIKLANILLEVNTNEVKLIDFDISALACNSPFVENPGTEGYMSAEMYDSSAKYEGSPAAVYSMGVVLYDIIFCARGWKLINNQLPMPKVSNECLDLICKMTATRLEDRIPFDKIYNHSWMQSN